MWVGLRLGEAGQQQGVRGDGCCGPGEQAPEGVRAVAGSSMRSVISLKVVSIRLRHSAMTFSRPGLPARCFLPGGTRTAVPRAAWAAARRAASPCPRAGHAGRPGFEQVAGGLALVHRGGTMAQARTIRLPRSVFTASRKP